MKIYDISWPITDKMTIVPGGTSPLFEPIKKFVPDEVRDSIIHMDAKSGTHVLAPSRLLRDGKTVDQISLARLIGTTRLLDLTEVAGHIAADDLKKQDIKEGDIVLLKTKNSSLDASAPFDKDFVALDTTAAEYLVEKKIRMIGFDYLMLGSDDKGVSPLKTLFENGITVVEGVRLFGVPHGVYFIFCLPLYVVGLEAAPARAVLLDVSDQINV